MKRGLLLFGGILWALFALGFLALLVDYVAGGAGLQCWIPIVSSESILVGLVHLTGLVHGLNIVLRDWCRFVGTRSGA